MLKGWWKGTVMALITVDGGGKIGRLLLDVGEEVLWVFHVAIIYN